MVAKLFSKLDYTVAIPYGKSKVIVPPYARGLQVLNEKMLGQIPKGIQVIKETKNKEIKE